MKWKLGIKFVEVNGVVNLPSNCKVVGMDKDRTYKGNGHWVLFYLEKKKVKK